MSGPCCGSCRLRPRRAATALALQLLKSTQPQIRRRHVKVILREWRAYVSLVLEHDWEDEE